ncbi:MAG: hypothetical protein M3Q52_01570 [Pseudomonadota bacterium]|nr:hypothetical protein [Pseudomonadota bacterium]
MKFGIDVAAFAQHAQNADGVGFDKVCDDCTPFEGDGSQTSCDIVSRRAPFGKIRQRVAARADAQNVIARLLPSEASATQLKIARRSFSAARL